MMKKLISNYCALQKELQHSLNKHKSVCIGKSNLCEPIWAFHKGSNHGKQILITAGIHAREFISSFVALKILNSYSLPVGLWVIPVCNPDGIKLCCCGIDSISNPKLKKFLLEVNGQNFDFALWKANINAVDLNVNFDADWSNSRFIKPFPSSSGYLGTKPNSEIEVQHIINFVKHLDISLCLSYHSKGEVIYFGHEKLPIVQLKRDEFVGKQLSKILGYELIRSLGSSGGLSDYMALKRKLPSFTIELGSDDLTHPIDISHLSNIFLNQMKALEFANVFTQQHIFQQLC